MTLMNESLPISTSFYYLGKPVPKLIMHRTTKFGHTYDPSQLSKKAFQCAVQSLLSNQNKTNESYFGFKKVGTTVIFHLCQPKGTLGWQVAWWPVVHDGPFSIPNK